MKNKTLAFLLLLAIIPSLSFAQLSSGTIAHNGLTRSYTLYLPANYTGNASVPLILNFHGFGGDGLQQHVNSGFRPVADTAGFILVSPTGTPLAPLGINHWNVGGWTNGSNVDDISFTSALIDSLIATYNIDSSRVYATGFSNGGFFSHRLACELGGRIAAVASVSGTFTPTMASSCSPSRPISVLQIHGTTDGVVPYNGTTGNGGMTSVDSVINHWRNYNNCGPTPAVNAVPDLDTTDGSTVERITYSGGDGATVVELLKISSGGHDWPGTAGNMDIIAAEEIWQFFARYNNYPVRVHSISERNFKLYPNPTQDILQINLPDNGNYAYQLFSITGKKIESGFFNIKNTSLNTSNLLQGIYILNINGETYKLIKE